MCRLNGIEMNKKVNVYKVPDTRNFIIMLILCVFFLPLALRRQVRTQFSFEAKKGIFVENQTIGNT